jgi:hypothetical protein
MRITEYGRENGRERLSNQFFLPPAVDSFKLGVHLHDHALVVSEDKGE